MGSLCTALASYLEARAKRGAWLLRIDDLDYRRNMPGAMDSILITLEKHGLQWDRPILFQSTQSESYYHALARLESQGNIYPCACTRKSIAANASGNLYPGICRKKRVSITDSHALRVKVSSQPIGFTDGIQGDFRQDLSRDCGDFVVRRRDNVIAYQLAVVIDDEAQDITDVIRGVDILDSTPRQIFLQQQLGLRTPCYQHLPVIVDQTGAKLSKQSKAAPVDNGHPSANLCRLLSLLNQNPPHDLIKATPSVILNWAVENWDIAKLHGQCEIAF